MDLREIEIAEKLRRRNRMKAVLVLDEMPDVCGNCFLFDVHYDTDMREICVPKYWHTNKDEKPDWCPLKELPEREPDDQLGQAKLAEKEHLPVDWTQAFCIGWNACLNVIENGEEE